MIDHQLATPPGRASDVIRRLETEGHRGIAPAVYTGFDLLDRAIGGLFAQDLLVVAGHPGVGKTITALQWARFAALANIGVIYVCYEHDQLDLLSRLLCLEIGMLDLPTPANEFTERLQVLHDVRAGRWSTTTDAGASSPKVSSGSLMRARATTSASRTSSARPSSAVSAAASGSESQTRAVESS